MQRNGLIFDEIKIKILNTHVVLFKNEIPLSWKIILTDLRFYDYTDFSPEDDKSI